MTDNIFSEFRETEKLAVGRGRKIMHSARDRIKAATSGKRTKGGLVKQGLGTLNSIGSVAGTAAGLSIVLPASIVTLAASPIVLGFAALAGVIDIGLKMKSDRDAVHKKLSAYTWSFIDDGPPKKPLPTDEITKKDLAATALSLLIDGKSQSRLATDKLSQANRELTEWQKAHARLPESQQEQDYDKAKVAGGKIFNYLRRLEHYANYVQAPVILAYCMTPQMRKPEDIASIFPTTRTLRQSVLALANFIEGDPEPASAGELNVAQIKPPQPNKPRPPQYPRGQPKLTRR